MARPWRLEEFDQPPEHEPDPGGDEPARPEIEEERLAAFDKGYKDGWDDAIAAQEADQSRITAEFAHNLQAMSFTYHEARAAVISEMEGLVRGMLSAILPDLLQPSLTTLILTRLEEAMQTAADVQAEIVIAPVNRERLANMLDGRVAPPLRIVEEPSLGDGQAFIRFGNREEKLDLDSVLAEMRDAIDEYFSQPQGPSTKEAQNA